MNRFQTIGTATTWTAYGAAVHESGHALVALVHGFTVAELRADASGGRCALAVPLEHLPHDFGVMYALAGGIANGLLTDERDGLSDTDYRLLMLHESAFSPPEKRGLRRRTEAIVWDHRVHIQTLADVLVKARHMNADAIGHACRTQTALRSFARLYPLPLPLPTPPRKPAARAARRPAVAALSPLTRVVERRGIVRVSCSAFP